MGCSGSRTSELETKNSSLQKDLDAQRKARNEMLLELEDAKRVAARTKNYARFDAIHLGGRDVDIICCIDELISAMQPMRTVNWVKYKNGDDVDEYEAETAKLVGWLKGGMTTGAAALPKKAEEEARKAILEKAGALWNSLALSEAKELNLKGLCQLLVLLFGYHRYELRKLVQVCANGKEVLAAAAASEDNADSKTDEKQKAMQEEWQTNYEELVSTNTECDSAQKKRWLQTFLIAIMKSVCGTDSPVPRLTDAESRDDKEDEEVIRDFVGCMRGDWKPAVTVVITEAMFYKSIISEKRVCQLAGISCLNGLDKKLVGEMHAAV